MSKFASVAALDGSLDIIATATEMYYCNGQPADRAGAIAAKSAAAIALTGADFVKSTPVAGTRLLTVGAKTATATVAQNTDHIALCSGSQLLYVTTAPAQTTNIGSPINSSAFTITEGPVA